MVQRILFKRKGEDKNSEGTYEVKLPKIITHVSLYEMQFGFKQQMSYRCGEQRGVESTSVPGLPNNVRL
jgi:hypothetical protein